MQSVAFTGAHLFVIAAIWFVGFGLSLLLLCLCCCCCQRRYHGYSRTAYALSFIFLMFTIAAIIGCVVLYTGQGKFHTSTSNTLDHVVWQANTIVESLGSVLDYLEAAKHIRVDQLFLPPDVQNNINKGSSIGLVKSMQPAISNPASADSVISSKTDPNLCFAMHAHSSISFSGLSVESSVADHQDWCFSNGSHGRAASIVS